MCKYLFSHCFPLFWVYVRIGKADQALHHFTFLLARHKSSTSSASLSTNPCYLLVFFIIALLMGVKWNIIVVLTRVGQESPAVIGHLMSVSWVAACESSPLWGRFPTLHAEQAGSKLRF